MGRFVISRLLQAIPILVAIVTLTFFMVRAAPGGPFSDERRVSPYILEQINSYYGLDKPLLHQYAAYMGRLVQFDLGPSYRYEGRTVNEMIGDALPVSLELGAYAIIAALLLGIPAGVLAASRRNTAADYIPMSVAMVGIGLPAFVLGPILALIFGLWLGWFNPTGWFFPGDRVLPALTLGLAYAAYIARLTRSGLIEVLNQDYIRTARSKGLKEWTVLWKHSLKGGLLPVVSFLGPALAGIITGSFVVETVFNVPGLGQLFVRAALNRDYTMVQGTVLLYASFVILMNLLTDIVSNWLNPRVEVQ